MSSINLPDRAIQANQTGRMELPEHDPKAPTKRVVYGVANYVEQVQKHGYFVDKTPYITKLELLKNPVFLRPRRFGKTPTCASFLSNILMN